MRGRLFDVGIAAGFDGFDAVQRVLKVGGRDQDGVDIFAGIQLVVVAHRCDLIAAELLDIGRAFFAAAVPDIGDGDELEVHILGMFWKRRESAPLHAIAAADDADSDAVVRAHNAGVAGGIPRNRRCRQRCAARLQKFSAIVCPALS